MRLIQMRRSTLFEAAIVLIMIALLSALMVAVTSRPQSEGWTVSGIISAPATDLFPTDDVFGNMFVSDQGTLYTIDGRNIHAIAGNGSHLWSLAIPDRYTITRNNRTFDEIAVGPLDKWEAKNAVFLDGNLIVLAKPDHRSNTNAVLLSVSPDGRLAWSVPFLSSTDSLSGMRYGFGNPNGVVINGAVLYLYSDQHWGSLTLIDANGTIFKLMNDIRGKPAFDGNGTMYVKNGTYLFDTNGHSNPCIEAYLPDGTLLWRHDYDGLGINESYARGPLIDNQPYLRNNTVYVWTNDGVAALNTDGSLRFRYNRSGSYLNGCGFDEKDTLYLSYADGGDALSYQDHSSLAIIRSDGQIISIRSSDSPVYFFYGLQEFPGGVLCRVEAVSPAGKPANNSDFEFYTPYVDGLLVNYLKNHSGRWEHPVGLNDVSIYKLSAFDLMTGEELWSHRLPQKKCSVLLGRENAGKITLDETMIADINKIPYDQWYASNGIPPGSVGVKSRSWVCLLTVNDTVYVNVWSYNYQYPPYYDRSLCVYSGGIYAYDLNGKPVWSVSTDTRVVSVQAVNGTVYYGTGGGNVSAARSGVMAGILVAAAYVFLRFFLLGTISRARLDKNDNRNRIIRYIADNPGASTLDVSRGLHMNHGTVRYHLLVLTMNHRLAAFKADEKYLRYFTNGGTYGPKDRLIISLMRREPMRKMLGALQENPGMSNMELARALGVPKSATMRSVKELTKKGVVDKSLQPDGKIAYRINSEYCGQALSAFKLLYK